MLGFHFSLSSTVLYTILIDCAAVQRNLLDLSKLSLHCQNCEKCISQPNWKERLLIFSHVLASLATGFYAVQLLLIFSLSRLQTQQVLVGQRPLYNSGHKVSDAPQRNQLEVCNSNIFHISGLPPVTHQSKLCCFLEWDIHHCME